MTEEQAAARVGRALSRCGCCGHQEEEHKDGRDGCWSRRGCGCIGYRPLLQGDEERLRRRARIAAGKATEEDLRTWREDLASAREIAEALGLP